MGDAEFEVADAANTTVLVTGATGRVGRVLVRKLLLRGYKVRALVRQRSSEAGGEAAGAGGETTDADGGAAPEEVLPQAVEQVAGDISDPAACRRAVEGVDKVWGRPGGCRCRGG